MAIRTITIEVKMDISNAEGKITALTGSMKLLGDEVKKTGNSTSDFERLVTKNLKDGETAFESLKRKSTSLRNEIGQLRNEFGQTGGLGAAKDLKKAKADLKTIEGFLKDMGNSGGIAGHNFGDNFGKQFILSFRTIPEFLASPVGGTLVGVLAPALIAGVAGAVTAGIGLGIVGAGAVILHNDAQIQAAFAPLKQTLGDVFTAAAQPMVQPILDSLKSVNQFIVAEEPAFRHLFGSVSPSITLITKGVEGLVDRLVPALSKVGETFSATLADPAVQNSLRSVADGFAEVFQTIGDNPKEVADGFLFVNAVLKGTFGLLVDIFNIVGPIVADLRQLRTVNDMTDPGLTPAQTQGLAPISQADFKAAGGKGSMDDGKTHILKTSRAAVAAAKANGTFVDSENAVNDSTRVTTQTVTFATGAMNDMLANGVTPLNGGLKNLDDAINSLTGSTESLTKANIDSLNGFASITKSVEANKKAHDKNATSISLETQTGRDNSSMLLDQIDKFKHVYSAQVTNESKTKSMDQALKDANVTYQKNIGKLEDQLVALGFNRKEVDKFITANGKIPPAVQTKYDVPGLKAALADAGEYGRTVRNIPHYWKTQIDTVFTTHGSRAAGRPNTGPLSQTGRRWGGIDVHAADGVLSGAGVYHPPTRYAFAEPQTGGEAFIPKYGSYARSMSILSAAAGWYGAHVMPGGSRGGNGGGGISVYISASDPQAKALLSGIRYAVQSNGGDVVRVFTPR